MQKDSPAPTQNDDHPKDDPALSKVIECNIRTIIHLRSMAARKRSLQGRMADAITSFQGAWFSRMCISSGLGLGFF